MSTSYFKRLKIAAHYNQDPVRIGTESDFADSIQKLFSDIRPTRIIETGTYLGTGTTTIIAKAIKSLSIKAKFYTIEVHPQNYVQAKEHLENNNYSVIALNGLSIPRSLLPTIAEIRKATVEDVEYDNIFVDHEPEVRTQRYYDETNFRNVPDNLLGKCLNVFDFRPDFVLLDSGGHIGNIEFNYLISHLRGSCYIALDDIYHIKHHKSFRQIQNDPRFGLITVSDEKFGFCVTKFIPCSPTDAITCDEIDKAV